MRGINSALVSVIGDGFPSNPRIGFNCGHVVSAIIAVLIKNQDGSGAHMSMFRVIEK